MTSAEDLADSIGKVGAVAKQAGVSIEELEGYTTSIVSSTGITGSEAGTALKSMISRTFRIGEEGIEDAGKVESTLNGIGIAVRKSATEYRNFGDILKDLVGKWGSLTNIQKQSIAQDMAGVYHISKFTSLMDNFSIATDATTKAMGSQGSAMKENKRYMDSLEGKLGTLKSTMEGQWSKSIDSSSFKLFLDILIKAIPYLMNFKTLLIAIGLILIKTGASASLSASILNGFKALPAVFTAVRVGAVGLATQFTALRAGTITMGEAFVGAKASLAGLGTVMKTNWVGILLTALPLIVSWFTSYNDVVDTSADATENFNKSLNSLNEDLDKVSNLTKEYENQKKIIEDSKSSVTDVNKAKIDLISTEINLKSALGDSSDGIDLQNKTLKENIDLINKSKQAKIDNWSEVNRATALQAQERLNSKNTMQSDLDMNYEERKNVKTSLAHSSSFQKKASQMGLEVNVWNAEAITSSLTLKEYREVLIEVYKEQEKLKKSGSSDFVGEKVFAGMLKELQDIETQVKEDEKTVEGFKNQIKSNYDTQFLSQANLTQAQKAIYDVSTQKLAFDADKPKEYGQKIADIQKVISTMKPDNLKKINEELSKIGVPKSELDKITSVLESNKDSFYQLGKSAEDYSKEIKAVVEELDKYKGIQDAIKEKGNSFKPTADQFEFLAQKGLIGYLKDIPALQDEVNKKFKEQEEIAKKTYQDMMLADKNFSQKVFKNHSNLINELSGTYNVEKKNWTTLAEFKLAVDQGLIKQLAGDWADYYDAQGVLQQELFDAKVEEDIRMQAKAEGLNPNEINMAWMKEQYFNQADKIESDIQAKMKENADRLRGLAGDFNFDVSSPSSSGKKESPYGSVDANEAEIETDRYAKLTLERQKYNAELEKSKAIQENTDDKGKIAELYKQIELYKQLQDVIHRTADEYRKERGDLEKDLTNPDKGYGFTFSGEGDNRTIDNYKEIIDKQIAVVNSYRTNSEQYKIQNEKLKDMQKSAKRFFELQLEMIPKAKVEWTQFSGEINKAFSTIKETIDKIAKLKQDTAKEQLDAYDKAEDAVVDMLKKKYEKQRKVEEDSLDESLDNYKKYADKKIEELDRLRDKENYDDDVKEINEKIAEKQKVVNALSLAVESGDLEAKNRSDELLKDIKDLEKDRNKKQKDRRYDLEKETYQEGIKKEEEKVNDKKKENAKKYEGDKEKAGLLDENALRIEAQKMLDINNSSIETIKTNVKKLFEETGTSATRAGEILQTQILDKIDEIVKVPQRLKETVRLASDDVRKFRDMATEDGIRYSYNEATHGMNVAKGGQWATIPPEMMTNKNGYNMGTQAEFNTALENIDWKPEGKIAIADYLRSKGYDVAWNPTTSDVTVSKDGKSGVIKSGTFTLENGKNMGTKSQLIDVMKSIGMTVPQGFRDGGVNSIPGLYELHGTETSSEVIFNATDAKKLFNWIKNPSSLISKIGLGNMPIANIPHAISGGNIEVNIDSLINVEGNVDKEVIPSLQSIAENVSNIVVNKIKNELNKSGFIRK